MAFSDDDLIFLRNWRFSRNHLVFVVILTASVLSAVGFLMGHNKAQPTDTAAPIAASPRLKPTAAPAKAETSRVPNTINVLQIERNVSIAVHEQKNLIVSDESKQSPRPAPTSVATQQPKRVQPTSATVQFTRERKVLTRADLDAELARRNEQNARDKAEIDRINEEKEDAKQERMRLAEKREREERRERLLQQARRHRFFTHHHIQPREKLQTAR